MADSSNHTIRFISPAGVVGTWAGRPGINGSFNAWRTNAQFSFPTGVAVDSATNVYVAEWGNHTIRKIVPTGMVSTLAGLAGSPGYANGTGSVARFYQPEHLAVDSVGNLWVADAFNARIRKVTPVGAVSTVAGGSYSSYDGVGINTAFNSPKGIAADGFGNIYVADTSSYTVRRIAPVGVVSTPAGMRYSSGSADGIGTNARFNLPSGVAVDSAGNVYVADAYNHIIRKGIPAITTVRVLKGDTADSICVYRV